ncbi:polysaccharide biosynthesis/export family protein [Sphingomonas asaccharolytica]|uniref:polysaccharide biosynthesis/export family protein n=1 Tax=Sphingomonas asaccharolytica TaxID=40681 RepID=UPI000B2A381C|nr:polysaccharide biosynthesis/export family protein [Sphingomonas asaccharolytica]
MAAEDKYTIGPRDKLGVSVFGTSDLDRTGEVDANGNFNMPLLGNVPAAGLTTQQFSDKLAQLLSVKYLNNPQITVTLVEANSKHITIDGSVTRPGIFPIPGRTTLLDSIAMAGGESEFALLNEVLIFRTVEGKRMVARFNVKAIRVGQADNPQVYGNDVIVVADSKSRRFFKDAISALPIIGVFNLLR